MALYCSKKLPALLRGIMSKHHSHFYCLNCLHFFATENKPELRKKVCESKNFFNVETKILKFNQYQNLIKHLLLHMRFLNVH